MDIAGPFFSTMTGKQISMYLYSRKIYLAVIITCHSLVMLIANGTMMLQSKMIELSTGAPTPTTTPSKIVLGKLTSYILRWNWAKRTMVLIDYLSWSLRLSIWFNRKTHAGRDCKQFDFGLCLPVCKSTGYLQKRLTTELPELVVGWDCAWCSLAGVTTGPHKSSLLFVVLPILCSPGHHMHILRPSYLFSAIRIIY